MQIVRALREAEGAAGGAAANPTAGDAAAVVTGAGGSAQPAAGASGETAGLDWISTLDDAGRQIVTAKGWKVPGDVITGYANLERLLGADKVVLPPKDANGNRDLSKWDGWAALGRPETPDAYEFKLPDGRQATDADKAFHAALRPALHQAGLAPWQLDVINAAYNGFSGQLDQAADAAAADAKAALQREWGGQFPAQMDLANRAARAIFGGDLDAATQVRLADGRFLLDDAGLARALAKIGAAMGEDATLAGGRSQPGALTPAAADAEIKRLRGEAFGNPKHPINDRHHPEHRAIHERLMALSAIAEQGAQQGMVTGKAGT